ncbi:MAG: hypothetical protein AB8E82_15275 [Aureispira sp.]
MPSFLSGSDANIQRLIITSHRLRDCSDDVPDDQVGKRRFKVQVNPEKLKYSFGYEGVGEKKGETESGLAPPGGAGPVSGFTAYNKMEMKFEFWADATGILPIEDGMEGEFKDNSGAPSIRSHLQKLQSVVFGFDEEIHGPPYLKLVWGKVFPNSSTQGGEKNPSVFKAMLKNCDVEIMLFSLTGEPVKAKITLDLVSQMAPEERPLGKSPDLTHYYDVIEGDKMTTYCNTIYGRFDSKICSAVAEYNNMIDWKLKGGTKMTFPSIHMLEDKYLEDYEEVDIIPLEQETEEDQMMALIGEKRAQQYYKTFPNKNIKGFES